MSAVPRAHRIAALADEHRSLGARIGEVRNLMQREFSWDDARLTFAALRETLESHFALEEADGYLSEVVAIAPEQAAAVARLESEHDRLRTRLVLLVAEALMARSRESLRESVRELLAKLSEHERRENEIVQTVFSTDVPALD